MYLWPYVEQGNLLNGIDLTTQNFWEPPATITNSMQGPTGAPVSQYYCPSDLVHNIDATASTTYCRCRGNYVVNWGMAKYPSEGTATPAPTVNGRAPFSHQVGGTTRVPVFTRITDIIDGATNTLLMSECLMPKSNTDNDWRGDIMNDDGEFCFMTFNTPNSSVADDVNNSSYDDGTGDPLTPVTTLSPAQYAARSRHSGGVNVALCDGSVRFVSNGVLPSIWLALGTMNGGEVVPGDF
jgi:prepilin-type processing-associated H-X9-DG protein